MFKEGNEKLKAKFYNLSNRSSVAGMLEIPEKSLRYFLYAKKPENLYCSFTVPKKNGKPREINAPNKELKAIQRKLAYILNLVYHIKPSAYGFVQGKGIKENAKKHVKKKVILNIDLKDFFSQIHFGRVRGMLISKPYSIGVEAATVIAQLACYDGKLPQGAPSSPILTNMICSPLDTQLTRLAKKYGLVYTRYADDITFSNYNHNLPKAIIKGELDNLVLGRELEKVLKKNSFTVNPEKIFLNNCTVRQEVTGLVVNKFPNIKREYIKELRAIIHNCSKEGIYETAQEYIVKGHCRNKYIIDNRDNLKYKNKIIFWFKSVLKGKVNFIQDIRGSEDYIFLKYAKELNQLFDENIFNIELLDRFIQEIAYNVVIIENTSETKGGQGSGFFLKDVGLITNHHVIKEGYFYKVSTYKMESIGTISAGLKEVTSDKRIDYASYDLEFQGLKGLELGNSKDIRIGENVTIIGYPQYFRNDSPNLQTCKVISVTEHFEECLYTVSARIIHGASGGVVLNTAHQVIGIVKGGAESIEKSLEDPKQGFIPIHIAIKDFKEKVAMM